MPLTMYLSKCLSNARCATGAAVLLCSAIAGIEALMPTPAIALQSLPQSSAVRSRSLWPPDLTPLPESTLSPEASLSPNQPWQLAARRRLTFRVGVRPSRRRVGGFSRSADCGGGQMNTVVPPGRVPAPLHQSQVHVDKTASAHPMFFVYVPANAGKMAQFTLQMEQPASRAMRQLYSVRFPLTGQAGIVGVALPTTRPGLQMGQKYVWQMALICNPDNRSADKTISGWVERVAAPTGVPTADGDALTALAEQGIWQDVVTGLALRRYQNSQDANAAADWADVMEDAGLAELKQTQIVQIIRN
jgi:hypothetical protein